MRRGESCDHVYGEAYFRLVLQFFHCGCTASCGGLSFYNIIGHKVNLQHAVHTDYHQSLGRPPEFAIYMPIATMRQVLLLAYYEEGGDHSLMP